MSNPGTTNLVSYWSLDEASGTRVDSHGSNNLNDNNTVGSATGIIGNGADFESSNSEYLDISDASQSGLDLTGDFAVSFWIRPESISGDHWIVAKSRFDGGLQGIDIWISTSPSSSVLWRFSQNGNNSITINGNSNTNVIPAASWSHVVLSFDVSANTATCYVDAVDETSTNSGSISSINNNNRPWVIGRRDRTTPSSYFDGIIDEMAVFNRTLTSAEVSWLYNSGAGRSYSDISGVSPSAAFISKVSMIN